MRTFKIILLLLICSLTKIYSVNQKSQLKTIEILNLSTTMVEDHIEMSWQINEYENSYFIIVERSIDAVNFTTLDTIYNAFRQDYSYIDFHPLSGISYYRIRCIYPVAGKVIISNITYIEYEMQQNESFIILTSFPIPFSESFNTSIQCRTPMIINFKLRDLTGSLIYESSLNCNEGMNTLQFPKIQNTGTSFYYLTVTDQNSTLKTIQLLKQNIN